MATIIIPQQPPRKVPVVQSSVLEAPALLVPVGTLNTFPTDTVTVEKKGDAIPQPVKIVEAPVYNITLAVPK